MDDLAAGREWPPDGLEHLGVCPVCGCSDRRLAYKDLRDGIFGAPGSWDLYRCACDILYLDPRPAKAAIHRAYSNYYTHGAPPRPFQWREPGLSGAVRRGYLNAKYDYRMKQASLLGALIWRLRRPAARNLDYEIRHLPAPPVEGLAILDVGCGNGDFMAVAEDLGYAAVGIDPDPKAVALARSRGLSVNAGTLPGSGQEPARYAHLFLNHVLEHLHEPRAALEEAMILLAPGGRLWLSLPNLDALGLARFGAHWRGLEPPRHLSLYSPSRLAGLLALAGFERICLLPAEEAALPYYRQSLAMECGLDPHDEADPPGWKERVMPAAIAADRLARSRPALAESLTLIGWKAAGRAA